jgi:hypothetical protein
VGALLRPPLVEEPVASLIPETTRKVMAHIRRFIILHSSEDGNIPTQMEGLPSKERWLILGIIKLKTIYPGWYQGRALHIHMKVFTGATILANGTFTSGINIHTGQLFFNVGAPFYLSLTDDRIPSHKI